MPKKLYLVPLHLDTVVYAEDYKSAMSIAEMQETDFAMSAAHADELFLNEKGKLDGLPDGWDETSVPFGLDEPDDEDEKQLTIGDIIEKMREQAARAKNLELPLGDKT